MLGSIDPCFLPRGVENRVRCALKENRRLQSPHKNLEYTAVLLRKIASRFMRGMSASYCTSEGMDLPTSKVNGTYSVGDRVTPLVIELLAFYLECKHGHSKVC